MNQLQNYANNDPVCAILQNCLNISIESMKNELTGYAQDIRDQVALILPKSSQEVSSEHKEIDCLESEI